MSRIPLKSKIVVSIGSLWAPPFDISNKVEGALINTGYRVVDRSSIEQVLREQKFSASGAVDKDQQIALGKMSGADYLLAGTTESNPGSFLKRAETTIHVRIIDLRTAEVVGAKTWHGAGYGEESWQSIISEALTK